MVGNLEWFRTFKTIYETGTMSGAARVLFVSQPGIGLHLNALEAFTGYPLFERTSRKMVPTEKGKLLYQQMIGALSSLEDIEMRFKRKAGFARATVSVGMCVETFQQVLEKHIPDLGFNLVMQFGNNGQLIQLLESGAIDLILTTETSTCNSLQFYPFTTEQLLLVAGKQTDTNTFRAHEKAGPAHLAVWLREQIWYSTAADMASLIRLWEINFSHRPDFVPNHIVPNKFSITRCLSAGAGLAILPDVFCREMLYTGDIVRLWDGLKPVENTLYFGKRKNPLHLKEIQLLEQLLSKGLHIQDP